MKSTDLRFLMKIRTTIMSVIKAFSSGAHKGIFLLFFLLLGLSGAVNPSLLGEGDFLPAEEPFVRIKWRQNFDGIIHREFLVKDARIVEVSEYSGVLMDSQGHIAVYIPDPLKLSSPQGAFSVSGGNGKDFAAELLGVDQRMSIAYLKVSVPSEAQVVFGQDSPGKVFDVLSWNGSGWDKTRYKLIEETRNSFGPVQTIRAVQFGNGVQLPGGADSYLLFSFLRFIGI